MDIARPLLTYILGFVALEIPRGRHRPPDQRRVRPPHVGLLRRPAPRRVPHTVELAAQLARISTDDQFQFGIRTFLAGLNALQPERKHSA